MKLISKKEFLPTVCVVYTILSFGKVLLEGLLKGNFGIYQQNLVMMLFLSFAATLVLSQHYRLNRLPLWLVALIQYLLLIGIVMLILWVTSFFEPISPGGYMDMFWSFTIPYIIGAAAYYISLYLEIQKANQILQDIKKKNIKTEEK